MSGDPAAPESRIRLAPGNALLVLAALAATLLVAEVVARLWLGPQRYHNAPLEADPELGFHGIPGLRKRQTDAGGTAFAFALNAQGLRGREVPASAAHAGVLRVAFVGDSFLFGQGIVPEALLTARVEAGLRERAIASEVYNLSAPDYGTGQELLLLRRFAPALAPDVVVLAIYPHNDLINNFEGLAGRSPVSPGDYLRPYLAPSGQDLEIRYTHPFRAFLRRHVMLYAVAERRALWAHWLRPFGPPSRETPRERLARGRAHREASEVFRAHPPDDPWEQAWQRTFALLDAFRKECEERSARLVVTSIPNVSQVERLGLDVHDDLLTRAVHGVDLDHWLDWNLPERRLSAFLRERGVPLVVLLPALRDAARSGTPVYQKDQHLNAAGHAIAADALLPVVAGGEAPAQALEGPPVRLPRGARAPRTIAPGDPEHARYLGETWIPWQSKTGEIEGALAMQGAIVALPARRGELVVRGIAAGQRYPLALSLEFVGGPRADLALAKPGPFDLRLAVPPQGVPTSDGYLALRLHTAEAAAEPDGPTGVIVREVGFPTP